MAVITMILTLLCGVSLFLFGMSLMGDGLKSVAGDKLEAFLYRMTSTPVKGVLLGAGVTSVIQSSSATTVMVIGFVNSGMMKLRQAIAIIMGANIGTSITGWILCLSYIQGSNGIAALLSSSTIAAVVAIAGTLIRMLARHTAAKNAGSIMLGFAILMVGMQMMSGAVAPLKDSSIFMNALSMFSSPIPGMLLGILMTVVLQSASASVGILQALSVTGALTFATAFPVILGIGVGAACPVLISSIGANKNGKRTALVYLLNDLIGMVLWAVVFYSLNAVLHFSFMSMTVNPVIIAAVNSIFRILTVCILFPFIPKIEELTRILIKDSEEDLEDIADSADFDLLEERLLLSPALALGQAGRAVFGMSKKVRKNVGRSLNLIFEYDEKKYAKVQRKEDLIDKYESKIGDYLMLLTKREMNSQQTRRVMMNLRAIGDLERIGDYASNIARITHKISEENISFSKDAMRDLSIAIAAIREIVNSTIRSFQDSDLHVASQVKPLSAVVSDLCEKLKSGHIVRLGRGECDLKQGEVFNELVNSFERIASHCVALSGAVRREYQDHPDYHVHSADAEELSPEQYSAIYQHFTEKYDMNSTKEIQAGSEAEAL